MLCNHPLLNAFKKKPQQQGKASRSSKRSLYLGTRKRNAIQVSRGLGDWGRAQMQGVQDTANDPLLSHCTTAKTLKACWFFSPHDSWHLGRAADHCALRKCWEKGHPHSHHYHSQTYTVCAVSCCCWCRWATRFTGICANSGVTVLFDFQRLYVNFILEDAIWKWLNLVFPFHF